MKQTPKQRRMKRALGGLVGVLISAYIFIFSVGPVAATGLTVFDAAAAADRARKDVELSIGDALLTSAFQSLMNTAQFFVRKISYDTAVYLASGGKGQGALIEQESFGSYLEGVALDTAGEAIHQLGEPFGLNLCEMPDIKLQAFIQIGLRDLYASPPQPNCSWQQLKAGWSEERFLEKYGPGFSKLIPEKFSDVVSVNRSDFGVSFDALAKVDRFTAGQEQAAALSRITNRGFKAVKDTISGQIITPASVLEEEVKGLTAKGEKEASIAQIAGIYGTESLNLIPFAAQTFLSTFASTLLKRAFSDGIVPPNAKFNPNAFGIFRSNREAAQKALTDFLGASVGDVPDYDIVTRFSACPRNPKLDNCVMDVGFASAVARGNIAGEALTIREAINEGLLHGDWPLISPRREVDNTDKNCYKKAYCYSNIQKMRKARIVPLGFEIAAFKADPSNPENWTLRKIVDNFANCTPPNDTYCHLIDPNWVIKSPVASCPSEVFGPNLVTGRSPTRSQECVDLSTCVATDEEGKCISQGFCTKEKNVWRFVADSCRAEYATCRTYERSTGSASSYLSRTLDFGRCSVDNVGCRSYSLEQNAQGDWLRSDQLDITRKVAVPGQNQILYLNSKINNYSCSSADDGCSIFYTAQRDDNEQVDRNAAGAFQLDKTEPIARLKKAPDYLGCYDTNQNAAGVQWPTTLSQIQTDVSQDARCEKYAGVCLASEVGCESYTQPSDPTAPAIPGVIGANGCSAQCVGYDTYKQLGTAFETPTFPLYFVPQEGRVCESAYVGCDEFTNLDERDAGGERLEYYTKIKYCEKPGETNQKAFYSWEGSDVEGFVLRVHNLKPMTAGDTSYIVGTNPTLVGGANASAIFRVGSPAYADDSRERIEENYAICNEDAYSLRLQDQTDPDAASLDCRAFYDDNGEVYYRLLADTVTISDQCRRLRKTNAELFVDASLTSSATCTAKGGNWAPQQQGGANVCQRCSSGGEYANGTCVYNAISGSGESRECPAAANQCRQYVGNTGRDINTGVVVDDFEGQDPLQGWGIGLDGAGAPTPANLRVAAEAIVVGGNSLRVETAVMARQIATSSLSFGASYELSFWARGNTQNIIISFGQNGAARIPITVDPDTGSARNISIGDSWREYRVGPVALDIDFTQSDTIELIFQRAGGSGPYYIDHVRLTQLQDQIFLIKNSWRKDYNNDGQVTDAPNVCDANPTDGFPGAALGCREYRDSNRPQTPIYATGFEQLCREEAVGCQPLWDTYNTYSPNINDVDETRMQVYNLGCAGSAGQPCKLSVQFDANTIEEYKCQIGPEAENCMIQQKVIIPDQPFRFPQDIGGPDRAIVVSSTIIIPRDTPESQPIFLAAGTDGKYRCSKEGVGCMAVGRETLVLPDKDDPNAYAFSSVLVKNDPALYTVDTGNGVAAGTLCQEDVVGCDSFQSGNDTVFFKDPNVIGQSLCTYREGVALANGTTINGWFYQDIGQCANGGNLCRSNNDCATGDTCAQRNAVPCYPTFLRRSALQGVVYDIRSNDSPQYNNLVGSCPEEQNLCTEFVDPSDVSDTYPTGRPYYVLKNQKIDDKRRECEAGASQVEGCILFDETNNPNRPYNSTATYAASAAANPAFRQVPPQSAADRSQNDSNVVLKVDRDRECSEWLSCRSSIVQVDDDGGKSELCYDYRACDRINPDGSCANWVGQNELSLLPLTESRYTQRAVGWNDPEYSGYTVFNQRQINDYEYLTFDLSVYREAETDDAKKKIIDDLTETQYLVYPFRNADNECTINGQATDPFTSCAPNEQGRCIGGKCYTPIDDSFPPFADIPTSSLNADKLRELLGYLTSGTCKAYPEEDSPFPQKVLNGDIDPDPNGTGNVVRQSVHSQELTREQRPTRNVFRAKKTGFAEANVCQDEICSCGYTKISYRGGPVDYYDIDNRRIGTDISLGVCVGGDRDGRTCSRDPNESNCGTGTCEFIEKKETYVGLTGFCLERDLSRPINGASITGSASQDYACLTWLPVQVSASAIDVFNTNLAAGYYPDRDATEGSGRPIYGKLYCTNATRVADGIHQGDNLFDVPPSRTQVEQWVAEYFTSDLPASNRGFFLPSSGIGLGGGPRVGNRRQDCSASSASITLPDGTQGTHTLFGLRPEYPYATLVCDPDVPKNQYYQRMQVWAWQTIGPNATVLRIEKKPSTRQITISDQEYQGVNAQCLSGPPCVNEKVNVFHFAPDFSNRNYEGSYGTVMHPPRLFNDRTINLDDEIERGNGRIPFIGYERPDKREHYTYAPAYSAEPDYFGRSGATNNLVSNYVHQFPIEQDIRDTDISRVYFVPTHYPDGNEGMMPELMTRTLYIDFLKLNALASGADVGDVRAVFDDDAVWPDGNYISDPTTFSGTVGSASYPYTAKRWTYVIKRSEQSSNTLGFPPEGSPTRQQPYLFDFYPETDRLRGRLSSETLERNRIDRRYVMVFMSDIVNNEKSTFPFGPIGGSATRPEIESTRPGADTQDPFELDFDCTNAGVQHENWFAIGMDFNADGEFLGYISRWCNNTPVDGPSDSNGVAFTVIAALRDQCTELSQVYDESSIGRPGAATNKAWTNRVWEFARNVVNGSAREMRHPFAATDNFTLEKDRTTNVPFGSTHLDSSDIGTDLASRQTLRNYTFRFPVTNANSTNGVLEPADGVPYACNTNRWLSFSTFGGANTCNSLQLVGGVAIGSSSTGEDIVYQSDIVDPLNNRDATFADDALRQLFAKVYTISQFTGLDPQTRLPLATVNTTGVDLSGPPGGDNFGSAGGILTPPQIYSLNPATCKEAASLGIGQGCTAGDANNITINDRNGTLKNYDRDTQNLRDEDTNADGRVDPLIGNILYAATMQFFAFADDDRMPIRRVLVDWGDGTRILDQKGFYKNRKPFCSTVDSDVADVGLCGTSPAALDLTDVTCKTHTDCPLPEEGAAAQRCYGPTATDDQDESTAYQFSRFGNARRACTAKPFIFTHDYTCTAQDVDATPAPYAVPVRSVLNDQARSILVNQYGLGENDLVCMFKPRVQALDNWGWCNGVNRDGTPRADGYYNDGRLRTGPPNPLCNPPQRPEELRNHNAWTPYQGEIYVVPPTSN